MAENKMATIGQLKMLASRSKSDSAARIAELAELIIAGLEEVSHTGIVVVLPAANWSGGAQTISHPALRADSRYWYLICGGADVKADDVTVEGKITFQCETAPETDLPIYIIRLEVEV